MWEPEILTAADAARIVQVWNQAQPTEPLTELELSRVLRHDPGLVLATDAGVVAVTVRGDTGHIRLLAVVPAARNKGLGRALLSAAEDYLAEQGATTVRWGAEIPWYLWPGLDQDWTPAMRLATSSGYTSTGTAVNMTISTAFHATTTLPVERLTRDNPRLAATRSFIGTHWSPWLTEVDLAADSGTLFTAFDGDRPVSFMAHSTLRNGWLGPMGTDPRYQGRGIGASVVGAACADLAAKGYESAQIAWVGPTGYFARLGARQSRTFHRMVKHLSA